ncbi:transmembrane protein 177 isoform X1 [Bombyx mori]|uniref:Transmembrane protein 177 n=1 Tax=Bombyx mori TaxID=7091 RepID=A0A8R2AH84_BOMMO|nr:transmembrane protein 177 [Bombyx mori]
MTMKRPINWFLTETGRKFTFAVISGTGIALTAARFTPNTIFLHKYKDFVQYYSNGKPVELSNELEQCYEKCLDILKMSDIHRKVISPFSAYGYDLFHAGTTCSRFGVAVGIPINFTYKSIEDLKNSPIQVNQKAVDWSSEVGKKLADALILPENVKKFAICREILMTHNYKMIYESVYPFGCVFFAYNLCSFLNRKLNLYARPVSLRSTLYTIVGLFSAGMYFLLKDMTEVYYETEVDKKLCELGPEFIESGLVFYDKILKRNQALRELMGKEGEKKYSKLGNENFGIRQPRLALMHRKHYFQDKLAEIKKETEDMPLN